MTTAQAVLLATPPCLLGTCTIAFRQLAGRFGRRCGYFAGFLFYWVVWCGVVPLTLLGRSGVRAAFAWSQWPLGRPWALGATLLLLPLVLGYTYAFPRAARGAGLAVVIASAALAIVNGGAEELLWRGTFLRIFPGDLVLGYLYPTLAFALWHLAPLRVMPNRAPGGSASFVAVSGIVGAMWGWVARSSASLVSPTVGHILFDFAGLGGRVYVERP